MLCEKDVQAGRSPGVYDEVISGVCCELFGLDSEFQKLTLQRIAADEGVDMVRPA